MSLFHAALQPALDGNGDPISGATWNFYTTGTLTTQAVYSDGALLTSLGATVTANASGRFVPIYLDDEINYRAILKNAGGTTIVDVDPADNDAGLFGASDGASHVGFLPAGTGGIATNVQTELRRIVHQDDYDTYAHAVTAAGENPLFADPQTNRAVVGAKTGKQLVVSGLVLGDDTDYSRTPDAFVSLYSDRLFSGAPWQEMRGVSMAIRYNRQSADEGSLGWDVIPVLGATVITAENTQYIRGNMKAVVGELIFQKPTTGTYTVLTAHNHQATTFVEENVTVTNWYGYVVGQPGHAGTNPGTITNAFGLFVDNLAGGGLTLTNAAAIRIAGTGNAGRIWWGNSTWITQDSGSKLEMSLNNNALVLKNASIVGAAGAGADIHVDFIIGGTPCTLTFKVK